MITKHYNDTKTRFATKAHFIFVSSQAEYYQKYGQVYNISSRGGVCTSLHKLFRYVRLQMVNSFEAFL